MSFTRADHQFMSRALQLARRGLYTTDPNPRVGCVITKADRVVGEGWHATAGDAHAEINALNTAGDEARGATVYVTLEPCCHTGRTPPCTDALIKSGVARVVAAMTDPNPRVSGDGLQQLRNAGIDAETGLMEIQARALNPGFISRMQRQRPYVRNKLAMSLDGRTAMASGESKWITGKAAREDVHRWRARSSAILTGVGTVLADDPALTARNKLRPDQPLRVVMDTHLSTPPSARLIREPGQTLILTTSDSTELAQALCAKGAEVQQLSRGNGMVEPAAALSLLAQREVNEVLLETGPTLSGAMLRAGLIDEMIIYLAPHLMGDAARGLFHLPGLEAMGDRIALTIDDIRAVGQDWRIIAKPNLNIET
jgi:diaminohydroxyphosphoribosylaminopyrimidine deaminase/5-amino-6-(5-phosphoribosylamino)uracil reductase